MAEAVLPRFGSNHVFCFFKKHTEDAFAVEVEPSGAVAVDALDGRFSRLGGVDLPESEAVERQVVERRPKIEFELRSQVLKGRGGTAVTVRKVGIHKEK